jgi:hypothetical protein
MRAVVPELHDEGDKVGRMLEGVLRLVITGEVPRRIPAECQDVAHARLGVALHDRGDVGLAVAHTGEVRHRIEGGFALDAHHEVVRQITRRPAGAVGHAHERRLVRFEFANGREQRLRAFGGLRWKKLKGEGGTPRGEDVTDVHEGGR